MKVGVSALLLEKEEEKNWKIMMMRSMSFCGEEEPKIRVGGVKELGLSDERREQEKFFISKEMGDVV